MAQLMQTGKICPKILY